MSSSDWVALGGLVVSCFAFAVSYVAYRLQTKTVRSDNEKELADQIAAIQSHLAELTPTPPSADPASIAANAALQTRSMEAIAKTSNINAALQTLLLRIGSLIKLNGLTPDWYQNLVLATAAVQIGDPVTAEPYAERAVELANGSENHGWNAETASVAQMLSLRVRANFYFNRGRPDDIDAAREDLKEARRAVRDSQQGQGPFVTAGRLVELYVRQTEFELDLGYNDRGAALMAKACHEWQQISAPAARQVIGTLICSFANAQGLIPVGKLLTSEFVKAWNDFQRGLRTADGAVPSAVGVPEVAAPKPAVDLSALHPIRVVPPEGGFSPAPEVTRPADPDR